MSSPTETISQTNDSMAITMLVMGILIGLFFTVLCILGAIKAKDDTIKTILILSAIPIVNFLPVGAVGIIIALGVVFAGWWKTPCNKP